MSRGLAAGQSFGQIAQSLGREASTVSRELSRLRYNRSSYRATFAGEIARKKRNHRKTVQPKLLRNRQLRIYVITHLRLLWSPEEIAARLKLAYPSDMSMRVSHETIYTYIYCLARGELKKELIAPHSNSNEQAGKSPGKKASVLGLALYLIW